MKKLKFLDFSTYDPVTLNKSKLQIHSANPTNPDIFINKVLMNKVPIKIKNLSFIHWVLKM